MTVNFCAEYFLSGLSTSICPVNKEDS